MTHIRWDHCHYIHNCHQYILPQEYLDSNFLSRFMQKQIRLAMDFEYNKKTMIDSNTEVVLTPVYTFNKLVEPICYM